VRKKNPASGKKDKKKGGFGENLVLAQKRNTEGESVHGYTEKKKTVPFLGDRGGGSERNPFKKKGDLRGKKGEGT